MFPFPPDYWKHCSSLNFPFPTHTWLFLNPGPRVAAGKSLGMGCRGLSGTVWRHRSMWLSLQSSDIQGAVALLIIQSDSHLSLLFFIPIYTHYKQVLEGFLQVPICSNEIKRCSLLGRKFMTNLDSILKSRGITLPTKVHLVKVFPVVMYGCVSWTMKKAECWRCSWTVVLDKTLESPLDCKEIQPVHPKGDQSWVFIGRTDVEAETPILWPPYVKSWCWERLRAGGEEDNREWDYWMASPTQWTWVWVDSRSWW